MLDFGVGLGLFASMPRDRGCSVSCPEVDPERMNAAPQPSGWPQTRSTVTCDNTIAARSDDRIPQDRTAAPRPSHFAQRGTRPISGAADLNTIDRRSR